MESTSSPDRIQISKSTADQLITMGKEHWVKPRDDIVHAKGLGALKTYWLHIGTKNTNSNTSGQEDTTSNDETRSTEARESDFTVKNQRLVDWIVELLLTHVKTMVSGRVSCFNVLMRLQESSSCMVLFFSQIARRRSLRKNTLLSPEVLTFSPLTGSTCLDEVQDVIQMTEYKATDLKQDYGDLELDEDVIKDFHEYVAILSNMYRESNPFHNFEHACHVTMSVSKLLKRIVAPELSKDDIDKISKQQATYEEHVHTCTYGISSDPLAQFAIVFSALIHDVDHRGCSNVQLIKEEMQLGALYKNKSVAEQNSLDLSWNLLMSERFDKLRQVLFETNNELLRFRQFIVNVVLATDIFDKELNDRRKARWMQAFSDQARYDPDDGNRKATIVIEHIIQASDVSHTMQHWHIYQKWNRLLFREMYEAYTNGRMATNPVEFWYKGELSFFDNYVIPLGKKLKDCNVFGVSSDEYLNYAGTFDCAVLV
jgi:3'5'-cyclic nucleotide phosphodiesterase